MERRAAAKPYRKALANFPKHKEEIEQLPHKYWEIFAKYPYKEGTYAVDEEDFFENLVLYCEKADHAASGGRFRDSAFRIVEAALREQRQEASKLYNPYRNLYLDKCYGESKTPLGEWMYFRTDEED